MYKKLLILVLICFAILVNAQEVPMIISYQGYLTENGEPVDGTKNLTFTMGSWSETHSSVTILEGKYSVSLGSITPIPLTLIDNNAQLNLQISVNGTPLTPDTDLQSVPYAIKAHKAANADSLGGVPAESFLTVNNDQKGIVSIEGVSNESGNIDFVEGSGITINSNNADNTVTFSASGSSGVSDITAGTGIEVSNPTGSVTITNTGDTDISDDVITNITDQSVNYIPAFTGSRSIGASSMYWASNGKIGIGTQSPSTTLEVNGHIRISGSYPKIQLGNEDNHIQDYGNTIYIRAEETSSSGIFMDATHNINLRTTNNNIDLESGNAILMTASTGDVDISAAADDVKISAADRIEFEHEGSKFAEFTPGGSLLLGTTSAYRRLTLPNESNEGGIATTWYQYSSRRWKENIQPLQNSLDIVKNLTGVKYNWKPEKGGAEDIGFIAEDFAQQLPQLVAYGKKGNELVGIDYAKLTAVLVEAIKEQQKKIEQLQVQLEKLNP